MGWIETHKNLSIHSLNQISTMSLEDIAHAIGQFVGGVAEEGTETVARKWLMPQNTTVCTGNTTLILINKR